MNQYWSSNNGVIRTFDALGYLVKDCALGEMQMFILDSRVGVLKQSKNRHDLRESLQRKTLEGDCSLPKHFPSIMQTWWDQNKAWVKDYKPFKPTFKNRLKQKLHGTKQGTIVKGLDAYILTDGNWQTSIGPSARGIDNAIADLSRKLNNYGLPSNSVRIHFIHFGHDLRHPDMIRGLANLRAVEASVLRVFNDEQLTK